VCRHASLHRQPLSVSDGRLADHVQSSTCSESQSSPAFWMLPLVQDKLCITGPKSLRLCIKTVTSCSKGAHQALLTMTCPCLWPCPSDRAPLQQASWCMTAAPCQQTAPSRSLPLKTLMTVHSLPVPQEMAPLQDASWSLTLARAVSALYVCHLRLSGASLEGHPHAKDLVSPLALSFRRMFFFPSS
jgi:hypothetical protein